MAKGDTRPGDTGLVMIWENGRPTQRELAWGLQPSDPRRNSITLLRWEDWQITNPCLILANDFGLKVDGQVKYRASLITDKPVFCMAGVWRPATREWPASYAALTTEAYPDIAPYKDRHIAIVREDDWIDWLRQAKPVGEMLRPFPLGSFEVKGPKKRVPKVPAAKPAVGDLFG